MKHTLIFGLIFLFFSSYGQTKTGATNKFKTSKYGGLYSYGTDVEKSGIGTICIYPESDTTILFYIDLNRGAPSYNMGSDYGRIELSNGTGTYYEIESGEDKGCKWSILFAKNKLTINIIDGQDNCGFGYGVHVNGTYARRSKKVSDSFENQEGKKIYFKDIR